MKKNNNILILVFSAVLTALAIAIAMYMPKIKIPPASYTLFSHVPIVISMFISPISAVFVSLGSTLGFFLALSDTPVIGARAATHIVWALIGAFIVKKIFNSKEDFKSKRQWAKYIVLALVLNVIHGFLETVIAYAIFGLGAYKSIWLYILAVGVGTFVHGFLDFMLGASIYSGIFPVLKKSLKNT